VSFLIVREGGEKAGDSHDQASDRKTEGIKKEGERLAHRRPCRPTSTPERGGPGLDRKKRKGEA